MAWPEDMLAAELDGLEFFCLTSARTGGRRTVVTEIPDDEGGPRVEDMGRASRRYTLQAVLLGDDYHEQLARLIEILERDTTHSLRHPWAGDLLVRLEGDYSVDETQGEQGIARVSMAFVEAGTPVGLTFTPSATAGLQAAVDAAAAASIAQAALDLAELASDASDAVIVGLGDVITAIEAADHRVNSVLNLPSKIGDQLADATELAATLVGTPAAMAEALWALWSAVGEGAADADGEAVADYPGGGLEVQAEAAIGLVGDGTVDLEDVPAFDGDPLDEEVTAAQRALERLTLAQATTAACAVFAEIEITSSASAVDVMAILGGSLTTLAADEEIGDALAEALLDLRDALAARLADLSAGAAAVETITPTSPTPAILIAWQIYGDPTRDLEIVARNGVRDPNLVRAGEPLFLLVDRA